MKAHLQKQYLLQIFKLQILKPFYRFFFLRKAHFKRSIYLQNCEEECLKHCYRFFLTKAHFKKQYLLQNSEVGCLKHCYGFFLRKTHFKSSTYLQNSEGGCLKHCYRFFLTEAHFKKQYFLLSLRKSSLNLFSVLFLYRFTL